MGRDLSHFYITKIVRLFFNWKCREDRWWPEQIVKGKVRPITGIEGQRGAEVQLSYFVTSALERGGLSASRPGRFTPGKDPVPIVQEAGWTPGPVWTCSKNLTPTGIRSPDRPARSQSLSRPEQLVTSVTYWQWRCMTVHLVNVQIHLQNGDVT
jgi:hypothetical protein